jgi:hypothetical protein
MQVMTLASARIDEDIARVLLTERRKPRSHSAEQTRPHDAAYRFVARHASSRVELGLAERAAEFAQRGETYSNA